MKFTERLVTFLKTLNPDAYEQLCQMSMLDAWKQFFFSFIILFALMLLLFIPAAFLKAPLMEERLDAFETLHLSANASSDERVTLVTNPRVVVDLTEEAAFGKEKALLTEEGLYWKPYYFFGKRFLQWGEVENLGDADSGLFTIAILFLAPSFAFWTGVGFLLVFLVEVLLFSLFSFLLPRLWKHRLSYGHALKLSLFAATVMMAVEMLLLPFWWNWWIPLLLYILFLAIGIALVGERELGSGKKKRGKHHDIWD